MRARGFLAAALAGLLIVAGAAPARAAAGPVLTSTGLTEGQEVGNRTVIQPVYSADVVRVQLLVDGVLNHETTRLTLPLSLRLRPEQHGADIDVTVRVLDAAGTGDEASTPVRVDLQNPTFTFDPPARTVLKGAQTITVTPTSDDVAEVVVLENNTQIELARLTEAPWSFTHDFTGRSGNLLFHVFDRARNLGIDSSYYALDIEGPAIRPNFRTFLRPGQQSLSAEFIDSSEVTRVEWWIDGAIRSTTESVTYDFGTRERTVPIEIRAEDELGNTSTKVIEVQLDATGPVITRTTPADGALLNGTVHSSVTATDPTLRVEAFVDGASLGTSGTSDTGTWYVSRDSADGPLTLDWELRDQLGNVTRYRPTYIVDNTLPKITRVDAPAHNARVSGTVRTETFATDLNGIARVELRVNGAVVNHDTVAPWVMNLNANRYTGSFSVAWYAFDKAGNVVSTSKRTWRR